MKIIAIDSSGLVASVAIVEDEEVIAEYNVQYKKTHSQTLLPMLDELKKMVDLDLQSVDAIAIAKDNTELLDKVNAALGELKESGKLDEIIGKYISAE